MKITNTRVYGLADGFRAMRNFNESWDESDSCEFEGLFLAGEKDLSMAKKIIERHECDFLKHITINVDIEAPHHFVSNNMSFLRFYSNSLETGIFDDIKITSTINYLDVINIYNIRKDSKRDEYVTLCSWISNLPLMEHLLKD